MLCNTWAMTFWHHICVSLCSTPVEVTQAIPFRDPAKSPLVFLKSSVYSSCINHSLLCPFISFCFHAWHAWPALMMHGMVEQGRSCGIPWHSPDRSLSGNHELMLHPCIHSFLSYGCHCFSLYGLMHWDFMNYRTLKWYFWKIMRSATWSCWPPHHCNLQF